EKKLALWKPYLMKLWNKGLKLFDYMQGVTPVDRVIDLNFGDYKVETVEQRTDVATKGITGKNWSILEGVKYTHKELTPEEQLLMAINIKIENGIMIFTKEEEAIYKKFIGELQSTPQIEPVSEVEDIDVEEDAPNEPAEPVGEEDGTTDRQE